MSFAIGGLGTALPEWSVEQARAAELINLASGYDAGQSDWISTLYRNAGVARRHLVMLNHQGEIFAVPGVPPRFSIRWRMDRYEEYVRPLVREASNRALEASGLTAGEMTHLVTVSCTGFSAPGFDLGLFEELGLDPGVQRTHVGFMGCHGALNGLRVAAAFAGSDPGARVLVCAAELSSLHFRYEPDPRQTVVNALFADGAAAAVGQARPSSSADAWRLVASGSALVPDSADAMTWKIGDEGFEMTLSPKVAGHVGERLRPWLESWLAARGRKLADIATWAVHPGGPKILDAVEATLKLPPRALDDSRAVLRDQGNMSSPTILFILDRLRRRRAPLPCVALAFGPGLAIEAALFE